MMSERVITRWLGGAVLVVCLVFLVAGCGGGSHSGAATTTTTAAAKQRAALAQRTRYEQEMKVLGKSLGAFLASVGAYNQSSILNARNEKITVALVVAELRKAQVRLRQAAVSLRAMKPPPDIQADHAALTKGVVEYAKELGGIIVLVRGGNLTALGTIPSLKGVNDMQRASQAITKKGYAIL
jgi:hypothetical protein